MPGVAFQSTWASQTGLKVGGGANMRRICYWCGEALRLDKTRGYVHQEGGTYVVRCTACSWRGAPYPSPRVCPVCGGELVDDHCVLPVKGD